MGHITKYIKEKYPYEGTKSLVFPGGICLSLLDGLIVQNPWCFQGVDG